MLIAVTIPTLPEPTTIEQRVVVAEGVGIDRRFFVDGRPMVSHVDDEQYRHAICVLGQEVREVILKGLANILRTELIASGRQCPEIDPEALAPFLAPPPEAESLKTVHQQRVELFMAKAKQELPRRPTIPSEKVRVLRVKLLVEEVLELAEAYGVAVVFSVTKEAAADWPAGDDRIMRFPVANKGLEFHALGGVAPDLVAIVDGHADISVVNVGGLSACGVADVPVLECVDANNLDKFGPGHSIRSDGKLIKPPDHKKPDFLGVIARQA